MNKFILEQLNKTNLNLPYYDNNTTEMVIPMMGGAVQQFISDLIIGKAYSIFVEDYVVHEPPHFTLSANWNGGTSPPENKMNVRILQINGKMIRVVAIGYTSHVQWEGWLPRKAITIISELD